MVGRWISFWGLFWVRGELLVSGSVNLLFSTLQSTLKGGCSTCEWSTTRATRWGERFRFDMIWWIFGRKQPWGKLIIRHKYMKYTQNWNSRNSPGTWRWWSVKQWKQAFDFAGGVLGYSNVTKHMIITVGIFRFVFHLFWPCWNAFLWLNNKWTQFF